MAKRFGRNQRRKMREQESKLNRLIVTMGHELTMHNNQLRMEREKTKRLETKLGSLAHVSITLATGDIRVTSEFNRARFGFAIDRREIELHRMSKEQFISDAARALAYAIADRLYKDQDLNRLFKP